MTLLFFDMEFADGRVPGSIYSFGYLMTNENFEILVPQTDLLINPESTWNEYVATNILAYPKETVEEAPPFSGVYDQLRALFDQADVAVGFALNNDTRALRKDCERYQLPLFSFRHFDTEKLCKILEDHPDAHGLSGCVRAWCGEEPDNRHRSDGDAYATMMLLRAVCQSKHVTPDMLFEAYPDCLGDFSQSVPKKAKNVTKQRKKYNRFCWFKRRKKTEVTTQ